MNALKLAAVVAIGFGTASLTTAAPPSCGACPSKAKRTVQVETADATLTASDLFVTVAACSEGSCPTADCPATCTGPGSACCAEMGCCKKTAACTGAACEKTAACTGAACEKTAACTGAACEKTAACTGAACEKTAACTGAACEKTATCDAPAPTACSLATCSDAVPATAVVVCSASSEAAPPAPSRTFACSGTACPITVCVATADACPTAACGTSACTTAACTKTACETAACSAGSCEIAACGTNACGLRGVIAKQFTTIVTSAANDLSSCAAECALACGTACRGAACDGGPCPSGVCSEIACETSPCKSAPACTSTDDCPGWVSAPALAAPSHAIPYPIAYEPAGLYGVQRTAAVDATSFGYAAPAAYAVPVETNSALPVGRWTRTLNDQSVTIAVSPNGSFTATCTVPNAGCSLSVSGDCRATEDGLLFGVVTSAKVCPGSGSHDGSVDPVSCVEVEGFCRALIDQPFSARCRVKDQSMTVSHALFGGIGFIGTPGPGEPAHLALTMFSGAYQAE
ncbi:ribosomal eL19 family protein [Alienimonas californiensis]|uniref:Stigma-specific protein, Stig1 n=1 Tax=Alienimonas californiensis TaxID=2527989 RepID=A0A517PFM5_9PLAN|nr:hypothetical protein [Alienimonas californiensis]QDT18158.1 hypothetical protein CA12_42990 [Alienimonas californiensis]